MTEILTNEPGFSTEITLAAGARRNALSPYLLAQLTEAVGTANPKLPLVLKSSSPCFCAGLDLTHLRAGWSDLDQLSSYFRRLHELYCAIYSHPAGTVALVDQVAVGGGCGLAFCHDLIGLREETRLELPGGDYANLARLARPPIATKIPAVSIEEEEHLILFGGAPCLKEFTFPFDEIPGQGLPEWAAKTARSLSSSRCTAPEQRKFQELCRQAHELVISSLRNAHSE